MKSITRQKTIDEIQRGLKGLDRVFIIGCGTCTTMTKTGGIDQVEEMKKRLQEMNRLLLENARGDFTGVVQSGLLQ